MFRVKICGITNEGDARAAVEAGADAVGFNFFNKSRRYVEPGVARQIALELPSRVLLVGVFVNQSMDEIAATADAVGLDAIQLHGDEPAEFLSHLPSTRRVVRAFRCGADGLGPLRAYVDACRAQGRAPDAVLVDADVSGEYGGSGQHPDWERIAGGRELCREVPLILAGGLTPENVAHAITIVRPDGVDVASGVESQPGKKDAQKVQLFVDAARHWLASR